MQTNLILVASGFLLFGFLFSALALWLAALIFGVRRPIRADSSGAEELPRRRICFWRVLGLMFLLSLLSTGLSLLSFLLVNLPVSQALLADLALGLLGLFLVLFVLRVGLPASWAHAIGIYITWQVFLMPLVIPLILFLRFFVFEAFVVPTGAMAEAILGYHKEAPCPSCGFTFPVNASAELDSGSGFRVYVGNCTCPNCRQPIAFGPPGMKGLDPIPADTVRIPDPGLTSGDRVVVGKGFLGPAFVPLERFDMGVFDWPGEPGRPHMGPPIRYIMRLVGLPGETVAIRGGKLYTVPMSAGEVPEEARTSREKEANRLINQGKATILRKKPEQVLALMRLVYDNDHPAGDLKGEKFRRWVSSGAVWKEEAGAFKSAGEGEGMLRYQHVLRSAGQPQLITDFLGYNTSNSQDVANGTNWANELVLECEAEAEKGEGEFALEVSKGPDRFQARFDLTTGRCTLLRLTGDEKAEKLSEANTPVRGPGRWHLRLANVDDRLLVWVDEQVPFGPAGVLYEGRGGLYPVKGNDLERPASVAVRGAQLAIRKLRLLRDTYYTVGENRNPSNPDVSTFRPDDPETWEQLKETPIGVFSLGQGSYFFLGDNSPQSSDSRFWGTVPERNMLGKVGYRYYPFPRAGRAW